jgi:hypothetical protein
MGRRHCGKSCNSGAIVDETVDVCHRKSVISQQGAEKMTQWDILTHSQAHIVDL